MSGLSSSCVAVKPEEHAPNRLLCWKHGATDASYCNTYNTADGVIVAYYNYALKTKQEEPGMMNIDLPDLRHWSDVAYLDYQKEAGPSSLDKLKYVFRAHSSETLSRSIVLAAMHSDLEGKHSLPGREDRKVYGPETDQYKALLASPNGAGVAWLLISHKQAWPTKRVKSVTVYVDSSTASEYPLDQQCPTLIFELEDHPSSAATVQSGTSTSGRGREKKKDDGKGKGRGRGRVQKPPSSGGRTGRTHPQGAN